MPVMVTFSEPVQNVSSGTFKLIDVSTGLDVPASVYTSIEGGRMRATLQPKNNMMYGKSYKAVLTTGITDSVPNPSSNDALLPLDHQYEAAFTSKVPQVYDLETSFEGAGTGDIALYTHPDGRTFAYITSGEKGWHVVDVTDPTKPFVTYSHNMSNQNLLWRYRGAAVNAQSGILAITEWIQWLWEGGSMYGYVRFYDLNANPAEPPRMGQERLAEEASGVPDKVAISGNFAFVTTLMVGLQVVDIDASKNYNGVNIGASIVGGLSTVDLEECPNPQNPSSKNCGSPSDIALIKNNLALIPTFSGSLLVIDVSTPQLPQLITSFRPQNYSSRRIAATDEYAYTDESGNNMVIDLAVTSSGYPNGNIHTIDVTEPNNPQLLGVVKNASGSVVNNIMANDITISKTSGLVYAAAGQSVYVIDIKDPKNPVILNIITETPAEPGSSTPTALGNSPALVEKDRLMKFNIVVANPPFSLDKWGPDEAEHDRYNRFWRGVPPKSKGPKSSYRRQTTIRRWELKGSPFMALLAACRSGTIGASISRSPLTVIGKLAELSMLRVYLFLPGLYPLGQVQATSADLLPMKVTKKDSHSFTFDGTAARIHSRQMSISRSSFRPASSAPASHGASIFPVLLFPCGFWGSPSF